MLEALRTPRRRIDVLNDYGFFKFQIILRAALNFINIYKSAPTLSIHLRHFNQKYLDQDFFLKDPLQDVCS